MNLDTMEQHHFWYIFETPSSPYRHRCYNWLLAYCQLVCYCFTLHSQGGGPFKNLVWIRLFLFVATDLSWNCGGKEWPPAAVLPPINVIWVLLLLVQSAPCGTDEFEEPNWAEERPPLCVWFPWSVKADLSRFNIWFDCPGKKTSSPSPFSLSWCFLANSFLIRNSFNVSNQTLRLLYVVYTACQCSKEEVPATILTSVENERYSVLYNLL